VAQLCLPQFADKGSCPEVCGKPQAPPAIRAPYYGMLFTQMAIAGLPRMLKGTQVEKVSGVVLKAHTLSADDGEELRIVLVRKGGDAAQRVTVRVTGVGRAAVWGACVRDQAFQGAYPTWTCL